MKGARRTTPKATRKAATKAAARQANSSLRWRFMLVFWAGCACVLVGRAVQLQVVQHDFLADQGDMNGLATPRLMASTACRRAVSCFAWVSLVAGFHREAILHRTSNGQGWVDSGSGKCQVLGQLKGVSLALSPTARRRSIRSLE